MLVCGVTDAAMKPLAKEIVLRRVIIQVALHNQRGPVAFQFWFAGASGRCRFAFGEGIVIMVAAQLSTQTWCTHLDNDQ